MTEDAGNASLGRLLVDRGVITDEQLEHALEVQRRQGGLLGEILTQRGWVTPLSIAAALARQGEHETRPPPEPGPEHRPATGGSWRPLGVLLVERGFIGEVELKQALAVQRNEGGFLGEILVERGWISAADLVLALAAQLGLDFDAKRAAQGGAEDAFMPTDRPDAHFDVLEQTGSQVSLLKTASSFMEATDYVFDEVLWQREPGDLQIVRVDGSRREVVWSFKAGEAAAHTREDMMSVFGYSVGQWEDRFGGERPLEAAG